MTQDRKFESGGVRSSDADGLDFTSMPWVGIIGVARTAAEGAAKYGRLNYKLGMPAHDLLNHAIRHQVMFLNGDRSEPHLAHAAWNLLAALESYTLDPALSEPHLLSAGATVGALAKAELDRNKGDLAAKRESGCFAGSGDWQMDQIPEIGVILDERIDDGFVRINNPHVFSGKIVPGQSPHGATEDPVIAFWNTDWNTEAENLTRQFGSGEPVGSVSGFHSAHKEAPASSTPAPMPCIYVSGPMSGHPSFNFPAFNEAAETLRKRGYSVVNPADFGADPRYDWKQCMARDLAVLPYVDVVVTLPGWDTSKGAKLEVHVAESLGIPVLPYDVFVTPSQPEKPRDPFVDPGRGRCGSECCLDSATKRECTNPNARSIAGLLFASCFAKAGPIPPSHPVRP